VVITDSQLVGAQQILLARDVDVEVGVARVEVDDGRAGQGARGLQERAAAARRGQVLVDDVPEGLGGAWAAPVDP
jgi:hypothetical protein